MPRLPRKLADGLIYQAHNQSHSGQRIFHTEGDYREFTELLSEATDRHPVQVLSYCLLPDYFYLLLAPQRGAALSTFLQWLMTSHAARYHRQNSSSGKLWQGRYKSFIVEEDIHLLTAIRYIEGSPVREGLVVSASDWRWSSHRERLGAVSASFYSTLPVSLPDTGQTT